MPSQTRQGDPYALDPVEVEAIRTALLTRKTPYALRDATLVSLMAYAGLRPEEALALQWEHIDTGSIRVVQANVNGKFGPTKTGNSRTVQPLISPLVDDLEIWRKASDKATKKALLFPDSNGNLWPEQTYANWRQRVFNPVAPDGSTPYSCRHGYASLLVREGKPLAEVAEMMGNSPTQTVGAYTHIMDRYKNQPSQPMEGLVLAARSVRKVSAAVNQRLKAAA